MWEEVRSFVLVGVRRQGERCEHRLGEGRRERVHLGAKVEEHGVGSPAAHDADDAVVNVGGEESSGPAGPQTAGGDFVGGYSCFVVAGSSCQAEERGNVVGFDVVGAFVVVVDMDGGVGHGAVLADVKKAA